MITAWTGHGGNQDTEADKNANVRHAGLLGILVPAAGADGVVPGEETV
jgi:hypothetical protein